MSIYDYEGNVIPVETSLFVNVRDFGAEGDGTHDDTSAIQDALDSLSESGGIVYFPKGTYILTNKILFYSNQTLYFENGATLKQGAEINSLIMSYCGSAVTGYNGTHDCLIFGATFDGGAYTTNNTLVGTIHAKNITFERCTFKNAYGTYHNMEINSSYNVKVINCDFEGARKTSDSACLIQIDAINNGNTWPWSDNRGEIDDTISEYIEIAGCIFHNNTVSPAIGNHSTAADQFIRIHDCIFDGFTSARGTINFKAENVDIYNNTFNGCTKGVASYHATCYVHDNRFIGATTAIDRDNTSHANMINGTFTS